jgi:hypothetical protein
MADIIEFNLAERTARRNPGPPMTEAEAQREVLRDALINIPTDARDLEHPRQMESEALSDIKGGDGGKAPA